MRARKAVTKDSLTEFVVFHLALCLSAYGQVEVVSRKDTLGGGYVNIAKVVAVHVRYLGDIMATNPPKDDGHRNGAVKQRSQLMNEKDKT